MIVGGGFAEGLRIGCRWGLGLVERKIHLRTLSPVVCTDRIVNQGLSSGREEERWLRRGCGGPNLGGTGTAQGSSRRIRGESPRAVTSSANLTGITLRSILSLMETFGKRSFFPPSRGIWRTRARCNARGVVDQVLSGGINVWCCCSCCQHWSASPEILAAGE